MRRLILFSFALLATAAARAELRFAQTGFIVNESASPATVTITVNRIGASTESATAVVQTVNGTAQGGQDFNPVLISKTWGVGNTIPLTFILTILNDSIVEPAELFSVTLLDTSSGTVQTALIQILDDDIVSPPASGEIHVGLLTSTTVFENAGGISFQVTRIGGLAGPLSLQYDTQNGPAQSGFDFTQTSGVVNFADQSTTPTTITIPLLNDSNFEPTENFNLVLRWLDGTLAGQTQTVIYTIVDDDTPSSPSPSPQADLPSKNLVDLSKFEQAEFRVALPQPEGISVEIFNRFGEKVAGINRDGATGGNTVFWNGKTDGGEWVPEGVYTALIKAGELRKKIRVVVLK